MVAAIDEIVASLRGLSTDIHSKQPNQDRSYVVDIKERIQSGQGLLSADREKLKSQRRDSTNSSENLSRSEAGSRSGGSGSDIAHQEQREDV